MKSSNGTLLPAWAPRVGLALVVAVGLLAVGCGGSAVEPPNPPGETACEVLDPLGASITSSITYTVPPLGTEQTLDVANWNIEWFGSVSYGPVDEPLQESNVRDVIAGTDADLWGLAEVVSNTQFDDLKAQLPGYDGFLANDPSVVSGSSYYTAAEQKVGLLYKTARVSVLSRRLILTSYSYEFAGRPPLEATLSVNLAGGGSQTLVVIVMHAKAETDQASWQRRVDASAALKSYLDVTYPSDRVMVIGDYNDDIDIATAGGRASPYANFVADTVRYRFPTRELSDAGISTAVFTGQAIDHQLISAPLFDAYVTGSATAYRVNQYIPSYSTTTSDHYPVVARYRWTLPILPTVTVVAPNGGETLDSGTATSIQWLARDVTTVRLELSLDGGATWSPVASNLAASAGSYLWTVPSVSSTNALVRVSDTAGQASDVSNTVFTIRPPPPPTPSILVTAPDGGESFESGTITSITWIARNVSTVRLELSLDGGATWSPVADNLAASTGSYTWTVPTVTATNANVRVRVSDTASQTTDQSDDVFTITPRQPPSVTVLAPNGGETFDAGSVTPISWTTRNVTTVRVELSLDAGASWSLIADNRIAAQGVYIWTVPTVSSTTTLVRVSDSATQTSDASNGVFTITVPQTPTPRVILNEIRANEIGQSSTATEFIELVNVGSATADLSGWTLSDGTAERHRFADGTTLAPGQVVVVYGGASAVPAGASNAVAATSGSLGLSNCGDMVALRNGGRQIQDSVTYPRALAAVDGVSMNRMPDGNATGPFLLHTTLSAAPASPGTRSDGTPW